jgi:outer membrane biosynthesis protein TonB
MVMRKSGLTVSTILHCIVLAWAIFDFARPPAVKTAESMPIDIISASDFSKLTAGAEKAPKKEVPKPVVDKVDAPTKPADNPQAKIDKQEVKATTDKSIPLPEKKPPPPKVAAAKPEPPKPETKAPEKAKPEPEQKVDPIAQQIKKEDVKKPQKKVERKQVQLPPKPEPQPPKFDPRRVAALLDKREAKRVASAGTSLNQTASLGAPSGQAANLSQSEIDALRARLMALWNPPAGARTPEELMVTVIIHLSPDGRLSGPPQVVTSGSSTLFQASRDSAMRAVFRGQPYNMLRPSTYDSWKDIEITFDPRDLLRG